MISNILCAVLGLAYIIRNNRDAITARVTSRYFGKSKDVSDLFELLQILFSQ